MKNPSHFISFCRSRTRSQCAFRSTIRVFLIFICLPKSCRIKYIFWPQNQWEKLSHLGACARAFVCRSWGGVVYVFLFCLFINLFVYVLTFVLISTRKQFGHTHTHTHWNAPLAWCAVGRAYVPKRITKMKSLLIFIPFFRFLFLPSWMITECVVCYVCAWCVCIVRVECVCAA